MWLLLLLNNRAYVVCVPGYILRLFKRYEKEIHFYDKVVKFTPKWHLVWVERGRALGKLNRHEEAISSYDKALEIKPNNYWLWRNRGGELSKLKRYEEAIASYDKALEINPNDYWIWNCRGGQLYELARFEEAIVAFEKAIQINPKEYKAWFNKGHVLSELNRHEEAILVYDKAIQIKPDKPFQLTAWDWHNRGNELQVLQQYEEAIYCYDLALALAPPPYLACTIWYSKGLLLSKLERYEEAIAAFEQLLHIRSDIIQDNKGMEQCLSFEISSYHHLMIYLGAAYALQGNIKEAQKQWQKGLEVCQEGVPWLKLSRLLYKIALGETEEGIVEMQKVLEEDISVGLLQNALEDSEMLARCSVEGSDRIIQLLTEKLKRE